MARTPAPASITYVTGIHFRGQPRQVVTAQVLYNVVGVALFLGLFVVGQVLFGHTDVMAGRPAPCRKRRAPGRRRGDDFNTVTPLLLTAALPAFQRLCARLAPPVREEGLARPQFLHDEVSDNAMATLILAEKEQLRLLRRCRPIAPTSATRRPSQGPTPAIYHEAFVQVGQDIERSQQALMSREMTLGDTEWLINQQKRQGC